MKQKMIDFLLENANPSIKRRVKTEILGNITSEEAYDYQTQIMSEPNIKRAFASQLDNGWFGHGFHGMNKNAGQFENQETCTKYLAEKAVDKDTPELRKAIEAFVNIPLDDWCYETRGKYVDEFKFPASGQNLIRCACIARAGYDDIIDITPQIQLSLDSFRRVLEVDSILDISRPRKGKVSADNPDGIYYTFHEYEKWPCRYHLDILAHTDSWKSEENIKMLADAITKMMRSDKPELVNRIAVNWVGHPSCPLGCFPSQGLKIKTTGLLPSPMSIEYRGRQEYHQMEYIEWLARCGVVPYIPRLQDAVDEIVASINENGICTIPVYDEIFKGWGPYAGLQLEVDWRSKVRRNCDITFRALLIMHYAERKSDVK